MRNMFFALLIAALCICGLCAAEEAATVLLEADTDGVAQVFYTAYLNGERAMMGGGADLDHETLERGRVLEFVIPSYFFDEDADLAAFSIDFSPFDGQSPEEMGRTQQVAFPLEWGMTYSLRLTGSAETGYVAIPAWEEASLEPHFDVCVRNDSDADFTYLRIDHAIDGEPGGYILTCPDEGRSDFVATYTPDLLDDADLTRLQLTFTLVWSDLPAEEALLAAMQGEDAMTAAYPLETPALEAAYGETMELHIIGTAAEGYRLEPLPAMEEMETSMP